MSEVDVSVNYIKFLPHFDHLETILIRYQIKYKALVTLLVYILRISQVNLCIYLQFYYRLRGSVSVVLQLVYKSSIKLLLVSNKV